MGIGIYNAYFIKKRPLQGRAVIKGMQYFFANLVHYFRMTFCMNFWLPCLTSNMAAPR